MPFHSSDVILLFTREAVQNSERKAQAIILSAQTTYPSESGKIAQ
jgi:hypothetical protein